MQHNVLSLLHDNHSQHPSRTQRRVDEVEQRNDRVVIVKAVCGLYLSPCLPTMPTIHDDPAALKALQDDIYRQKVLRARGMTALERLAEAFELTNSVFTRMHEGAMWQLGTTDPAKGWMEVRRRMDRLGKANDHGIYTTEAPTA